MEPGEYLETKLCPALLFYHIRVQSINISIDGDVNLNCLVTIVVSIKFFPL